MPRQTLKIDYLFYNAEVDKLHGLLNDLSKLEAKYQKLAAEIILLRVFYLLENTFKAVSCKLICGTVYLDGSASSPILQTANMTSAIAKMEGYCRPRHRRLTWTKVSEIKENIKYMLQPSEHFITKLDAHSGLIDEIRRIRNRIAHNNKKTRQDFAFIVRRHYGANLNSITPGALLISPRFSPVLLQNYIVKTRILIKELVKA